MAMRGYRPGHGIRDLMVSSDRDRSATTRTIGRVDNESRRGRGEAQVLAAGRDGLRVAGPTAATLPRSLRHPTRRRSRRPARPRASGWCPARHCRRRWRGSDGPRPRGAGDQYENTVLCQLRAPAAGVVRHHRRPHAATAQQPGDQLRSIGWSTTATGTVQPSTISACSLRSDKLHD